MCIFVVIKYSDKCNLREERFYFIKLTVPWDSQAQQESHSSGSLNELVTLHSQLRAEHSGLIHPCLGSVHFLLFHIVHDSPS